MTQLLVPKERKPHKYRCENLRTRTNRGCICTMNSTVTGNELETRVQDANGTARDTWHRGILTLVTQSKGFCLLPISWF
jgi:hypothetical protein